MMYSILHDVRLMNWNNHKNVQTTTVQRLHHAHACAAFAIWPVGQTTCYYHNWWVSKKLSSLEPKSQKESRSSLESCAICNRVKKYQVCFLLRKSRVANHHVRQMTPYLPNKTFLVKSTQYISLKSLYTRNCIPFTLDIHTNQVCSR